MGKCARPEKRRTVWRWSRSYRRAHVPPSSRSCSSTTAAIPSRMSAAAAESPDAPPPTTITVDWGTRLLRPSLCRRGTRSAGPFTFARCFFAVSRRSFAALARPRGPARPGPNGGLLNQRGETCPSGLAVLSLCAMFPAVEYEHAFGSHAATGKRGQTRLDVFRKRRGADVEAQLYGVATLFTFCPPGPDARTNRSSISRSCGASVLSIGVTDPPASRVYQRVGGWRGGI